MKKFTDKEYRQRLIDLKVPFVATEEYVDTRTKILHKCTVKECGHEWKVTPTNVIHSKVKCPACMMRSRTSVQSRLSQSIRCKEDYVKALSEKFPTIKMVGEWTKKFDHTDHECKCGYKWNPQPIKLLLGKGCPKCNKVRYRKTTEDYRKEVEALNPKITVIDEYKKSFVKVKMKCKLEECGHEWYAFPSNLKLFHKCPKCKSKDEKENIQEAKQEVRV